MCIRDRVHVVCNVVESGQAENVFIESPETVSYTHLYIISGIKTSNEVKVGDTITHVDRPCDKPIAGFQEVKPMVFAGVYPIESEDFENLRASLEKLQLNDASITFPVSYTHLSRGKARPFDYGRSATHE